MIHTENTARRDDFRADFFASEKIFSMLKNPNKIRRSLHLLATGKKNTNDYTRLK